jgi:hypothetical protein
MVMTMMVMATTDGDDGDDGDGGDDGCSSNVLPPLVGFTLWRPIGQNAGTADPFHATLRSSIVSSYGMARRARDVFGFGARQYKERIDKPADQIEQNETEQSQEKRVAELSSFVAVVVCS